MIIDPDTRISYAELDSSTAVLGAGLLDAGIGKGTRVGLIMPNSAEWVRIALAVTRIGAVLVPLSTLLTTPELTEQLRVASVQHLIAVEEFRGRRYHAGAGADSLRRVWTPGEVLALARHRPVPAGPPGGPDGHHVHLRQQRTAEGCLGTLTAMRWLRCVPGWRHVCITEDTRLYLPMPFFWVGGFGGGDAVGTAGGRHPGRPSRFRSRSRRWNCCAANGSRCFAAGPTRRRRWPGFCRRRCPICRSGSLEALLPPSRCEQCRARGHRCSG